MGILNVTPDSFSDGGELLTVTAAVNRGIALIQDGADYLDVGGESTRPGADRVDVGEEMRRVLPVVEELSAAGFRVSIDTTRARVAEAAIAAGAQIVNDVSGGQADPDMASVVAASGTRWVLTHSRRPSKRMYVSTRYTDILAEVRAELLTRVDAACEAGVRADQLVLDPGFGFSKRPAHDLALLGRLDELTSLGFPVLVGASRKSFLAAALSEGGEPARPPRERDSASLAAATLAAAAGASCVRVHDVAAAADAIQVVASARRAASGAKAMGRRAHGLVSGSKLYGALTS